MTAARILEITLSNIGDAIMTTPALVAIHAKYPDALIELVCDVRSSAVFEPCPCIGHLCNGDRKSGWQEHLQLINALRKTRYKAVVDLCTDFGAYWLRAKRTFSKSSNAGTLNIHPVQKHMAAAGLPTLTLFGPGLPVRYKPWSKQPCFILDSQQHIHAITVENVVSKLQGLLARTAN